MLPDQQLMDPFEKETALRSLNDAVIVGTRKGNDLADAELAQSSRGHRLVLGRILDRAGRNDRALSCHQSRIRRYRTDRTGIRQRDGRALEIRDLEFPVTRLFYLLVVSGKEPGKVHRVGTLDIRYKKISRTVLFLDIDSDPEIDAVVHDPRRSAVDYGEPVVHCRIFLSSLHDRPGYQVCERSLAASGRL